MRRSVTHTDKSLTLIIFCALFAALSATGSIRAQAPPASPATYGVSTDHLATVDYADGRLSVVAKDSSLNQILREISRKTGMKITGGVTDERVFGNYGPDTPAKVLSALLDGTGSNMLLIQGSNHQATGSAAPVELVLTPRNGGPTPPNPHPPAFDNGPRPQPFAAQPNPAPPYVAAPPPPQPVTPASNPNGTAAGTGAGGASSTDSTQQQSPNDVRTPQQIYDQLLRIRQLQQQQQQQQPAKNP